MNIIHLSSCRCRHLHHILYKIGHFRSMVNKQVCRLLILQLLFCKVHFSKFIALIILHPQITFLKFILKMNLPNKEMLYDNDMFHDHLDERGTSQLFQSHQQHLLLNHIQLDKMGQHCSLKLHQKIMPLLQIHPKQFQIYLLNSKVMHFKEHCCHLVSLCCTLNGLNHKKIKHQTSTVMTDLTSNLQYNQTFILIKFPLEIKSSDLVNHYFAF